MSDRPTRILTQKQMQSVRSEIGFCYLCGEPLPRKAPGRARRIMGEHVIPRALLAEPPTSAAESWSVELDVHCACESRLKKVDDNLLALLQKMSTKPAPEWPASGHVRNLALEPILLESPQGDVIPAFENVTPVLAGAWTWVRGLHAAIYLEYLPEDTGRCVLPPVPAWNTKGITLPDAEMHSVMLRAALKLGLDRGKWDGIDAWGHRLKYRCVWKHLAEQSGASIWWCCWGLTFPGVLEWSRSVLAAGSERPWHGQYFLHSPPPWAAQLSGEDFQSDSTG